MERNIIIWECLRNDINKDIQQSSEITITAEIEPKYKDHNLIEDIQWQSDKTDAIHNNLQCHLKEYNHKMKQIDDKMKEFDDKMKMIKTLSLWLKRFRKIQQSQNTQISKLEAEIIKLKQAQNDDDIRKTEVETWLKNIVKLPQQYYQLFIQHGFDDLESVSSLTLMIWYDWNQ